MNFEEIMRLIGRWGGTLQFFPSDPDARIGIAEEIAAMCSDVEQVRWLVQRVPKLHREWPGILEVRAVLCSKFRPRDGIDVGSSVYLEGIPSETGDEHKALTADEKDPARRGLPLSASPSLAATVSDLAAAIDMRSEIRRRRLPVREIPEVRITDTNRITADDVQREVERQRQAKAERELEIFDAELD